MLDTLRKHTKTIVWVVVLGFAIWGAGTIAIGRQQQGVNAGTVFGQTVKLTDYNRASKTVRLLTAVGNNPDLDPNQLSAEIWKHIILAREAKQKGITVSDREVTNQIETLFSNETDGFDRTRYEYWVRTVYGEQPRHFEEQVRNTIAVMKLMDSYRPVLEPAEDELWNWYRETFLGGKTEEEIEDAASKRESFLENKEQWERTYRSFKEAGALGEAIEEIEKRANLVSFIPPSPAPSASAQDREDASGAEPNINVETVRQDDEGDDETSKEPQTPVESESADSAASEFESN